MNKLIILFTSLVFTISISPSAIAQAHEKVPFRVVTEVMPPYSYVENGEVKGIATDKIKKALKWLGKEDVKINVWPWARAYNATLNFENVLIYSMIRTKTRENAFKWVVKLADSKVAVFKLKSRTDIKIKEFDDLRKYRLGAFIDSAGHQYFSKRKFKKLTAVGVYDLMIQMLVNDRLDIVPSLESSFMARAIAAGVADQLEIAYYVEDLSKPLWAAFGNKTSDKVVEQFKKAFQATSEDRSLAQ